MLELVMCIFEEGGDDGTGGTEKKTRFGVTSSISEMPFSTSWVLSATFIISTPSVTCTIVLLSDCSHGAAKN